ncbi:hypothetical protein A2303_00785 [Candidatus Falkowbacteria bacterium RIFOXYB2_FULL_47_14]|uniref:Transcription regulator TrmB N-terminal domain-containing protein n=1 Tax=Candidatus Falkowbacteria bacterium RIFOXYA2_FULL_47_19 TaxID=1797994 RepID=A0A1F5SN11_9BACT|nr:MAG: hypothetical protein A2227_05855 [Candidatus Falkowbacteria bacterium RIFOXYA2_FULL_47_19]OGF35611.1 MAG: hypothetical protein A2468_06290 [Candidatus Falkowbacteria bacterium RIFOXYC2_FULL_46_15]OGF42905.1 MAG: hypothetical protein A2303_00785 [Candidatus Falkowbacteria bacterium RIFOXYB2_FULL_47_14]
MIDFKIISDLGLSDKETALYMACLKTGPSGASELAKTTGIQRTHIYDLAEKLADKGFLTQTRKEDKKIFAARSPEEILAVKRIELKKFADSIPELEKLARQKNNRPKIFYYEGGRELNKMMEGSIWGEGECLIWGDDLFYTKDEKEYQKKNIAQRLKTNTRCRVLAAVSNATLESQKKDKKELRETRLLPRNLFESRVNLTVYKNKTMVANHAKDFGFAVEDEDFADTLKAIFELIWKSGRVI